MALELMELPYDKKALEPYMSAQTLEFHHDKHHQAYVNKANELIKGTELEGMDLRDAVVAANKKGNMPAFNNLGQTYNHNIFWNSLTTDQNKREISEPLESKINEKFGSFEKFKEEFVAAGMGQFGSGWVWLATDCKGELSIVKTANADSPLTQEKTPLFGCDVWEHSYYLDFQNRRADYLASFIDNLANWEFALHQYLLSVDEDGECSCGSECGCCG